MKVLLAVLVLISPLISVASPSKRELSFNDADHKDNRLFKRKGSKKGGSKNKSSRKWSSRKPFYYPPKQVIIHHKPVICWPSPAPSHIAVKPKIKTIYIIKTVTAPAPTIPNYQPSISKAVIKSTATSKSYQPKITVTSTHSQNHSSNQPSITVTSTHSQNHSTDQPAFRDTPNILLQDPHITTETQTYLETSIYMPFTSTSGTETLSYFFTENEDAKETAVGLSDSDPNGGRLILDFPIQSPALELDAPDVPEDRPTSSAIDLRALEYMLYFCILIGFL